MPTPKSNIRDASVESQWSGIHWASLILIAGSMLYKFFDRSVMFHDEIINISKGQHADILNYAIRPVFYAINALSVRFLGSSTLALSLAAYIAFVVIVVYTYKYIKRDLGAFAGVAGVAALAWSGLIYYTGIRGMPHLYPAAFFAAAIYYYHQVPILKQGGRHRFHLAVLLWLTLLSHPTALALLVGFFAMVMLDLWRMRSTNGTKMAARILFAWSIPMLALWGFVESIYYVFSTAHKSYFGYWIAGLHKTSSDNYQRYFEPYDFYFEKIAGMLLPLLLLAAILIFWLAWKMWRTRETFALFASNGGRKASSLLVVAVVSVSVVSLEKWKFDRVLVTFLPIVVLAVVYLIFWLVDSIAWRRYLLFAMSAGFVVIVSAISFVGQAKDGEAAFLSRYPTYSASFDVIRHLPTSNIGYIGNVEDMRGVGYPVGGSGKTIEMTKLSPLASTDQNVMARELMAAGNRYVVVSMLGDQDTIRTFHKLAYSARFSRRAIFASRRAYELWELNPSSFGDGIDARLEVLPRNARLGLLLNNKRDIWIRWTLEGGRFKFRALRGIRGAESIKSYSFIFLSTSSKSTRKLQNELAKSGMHKVGEISAMDGSERLIEMWGR